MLKDKMVALYLKREGLDNDDTPEELVDWMEDFAEDLVKLVSKELPKEKACHKHPKNNYPCLYCEQANIHNKLLKDIKHKLGVTPENHG